MHDFRYDGNSHVMLINAAKVCLGSTIKRSTLLLSALWFASGDDEARVAHARNKMFSLVVFSAPQYIWSEKVGCVLAIGPS